jgi:DDE_Tnp_1-associated
MRSRGRVWSLVLKHFSQLDDAREPWRILYPLHEVLLLVTCATIASCDDFDDIVAWGQHHLAFLAAVLGVLPWDTLRALGAQPR